MLFPAVRTKISSVKSWLTFPGSERYWKERYRKGGNAGVGSFGRLANFKAEVLNDFVAVSRIQSVIEFGCGDGNQLWLAKYPRYRGYDISELAIAQCRQIFKHDTSKSFHSMSNYRGEQAELALSVEVICHLVEQPVFANYMQTLFNAATRYVVIYSSNTDKQLKNSPPHVRQRCFTPYVKSNFAQWKLVEQIRNRYPFNGDVYASSMADFFIYWRR